MNFKRKSAASLNDQGGAKCFARLGSKIAEPFRGNIENKYLDGDLQKNFNVIDERRERFNRFLND